MLMRAAVLHDQGRPAPYTDSRPLVIEQVTLSEPGPGEVLIKVFAAGICHSDLSAIAGNRPRPLPVVGGHEAVGVVAELGPNVQGFALGDHVVTVFVAGCGQCVFCHKGQPNLCEASWRARTDGTLLGGHRRLGLRGGRLHHWSGVSAFADYAVVASGSLVRISPEIDMLDAATLGCAVLTGFGAVINSAGVSPGQTVAIIGLGGVGLSAVMGASAAGASRIVAVDLARSKLKLATELGATDIVNASESSDVGAAVFEITGGVDVAFDMAGTPGTVASAYAMARRGGTIVVAGLPSPDATFALPIANHVADEKRLVGSYMGGSSPQRDIPVLIALHKAGRLPLSRLRSSVIALEDINDGLERMRLGLSVRDIVGMTA